jgi:hypothetical protein
MSHITEPSADQLNAPYAVRWGLLKDVMVHLYLTERKQLKQISEIMKISYKFYASSVTIHLSSFSIKVA